MQYDNNEEGKALQQKENLKQQLDTAHDSLMELIKLVGLDNYAGSSCERQLSSIYDKVSDCLDLPIDEDEDK